MKKYQIEALFYNIGWEVPNEADFELFDTKEEAEAELADFLDGLEYAVKMGYMEDMEAHDWRVAAIQIEE